MSVNQKPNTDLPPEWDREWSRNNVQTTNDDLEAHYDRGGIVLMTKFVGGDDGSYVAYYYPGVLIEYLKDFQRAGVLFNATAFLEDIRADIARGGLERGHALVRLVAYTLSQPPSLTQNIRKHVGVEDQKFVVSQNGRGWPDEVFELAMQIIAPENSESAAATGEEPVEAEQTDEGAPLFVEDAKGVRLVDQWWIDRGLAQQNGTLKSAVKHFLPETLEELDIINAERAKEGLPPTSKEDLLAYGNKVARQLGLKPQIH